jgi:Flp pilus assembly protein TadG
MIGNRRFAKSRRGQSLVEFAIVLPVLLALIGGIVQVGVIYSSQHALIQVARDTGRWAATQINEPCNAAASATPRQPVTQADIFASGARLLGYKSGDWNSGSFTVYGDNAVLPSTPAKPSGVEVVWSRRGGGTCVRPTKNTDVEWVTVRVAHQVPVFIPLMEYLPTSITCAATGCTFPISAKAQFRMEPQDDQ